MKSILKVTPQKKRTRANALIYYIISNIKDLIQNDIMVDMFLFQKMITIWLDLK